MLKKVMENVAKSANFIRANKGGHLIDIAFKQ